MDIMDLLLLLLIMWLVKEALEFGRVYKDLMIQKEQYVEHLHKEILAIIPVKVELHDNCYYFFHETTGEFIAQGKTEQEVEKAIKARYGAEKKLAVDTNDPIVKQFIGIQNAQAQ